MKILHVCCSPRGQTSASHALAQKIIDHLLQIAPAATLTNRVVGDGSIPPVDSNYAVALGSMEPTVEETSEDGSIPLSETLIQELENADVVVIGTPMHNFTVPSTLKAWIDHIVRVRRTFDVTPQGKVALLRDRPIFFAVASGGRYSGDHARQPDFFTPYLKAILATIGLHDLAFFSVEGTALGPDAIVEANARTDRALKDYFLSSAAGHLLSVDAFA